jgi:hypothetical protein
VNVDFLNKLAYNLGCELFDISVLTHKIEEAVNIDGAFFFRIKDLVSVSALTDRELKDIYSISNQIHGLGFALTCDWLKECGCTWLAKPDVHINGVVKYLKADEKLKDEDVLKLMFSWAETVKLSGEDKDATAYKIDKIIWLLCTGEFYLDDRRVGREAMYRKIDALR